MRRSHRLLLQIDGITGQKQTYAELLSRCIQCAEAMRAYGIKSGDVISPCTHNILDTCVPLIAALFIGAHSAAIDIVIPEAEMKDLLIKLDPKIIFTSKESEEILICRLKRSRMDYRVIVFGSSDKHESFESFLESAPEVRTFEVCKAKSLHDTAFMCLSGGSTGASKIVCVNHFSMMNFVRNYQ